MNGAHVALVGRVTRPGELRYASTGTAMLRVGVLIEDAKRQDGNPPDFANVTIWSERAEKLAGQVQKGSTLYIEGKVKPAAWTAADGTVKCNLDISAWKVEILGAIGRSAPRRQDDRRRPNAMPQAVAIGGRNTRQQLGLDDEPEGWPA